MRIAGGEWRGRILKTPEGDAVRPTQDRVREALFNILMHDIAGARFLDVFAGSGSVGLEAMSRGAASVTFVERSPRHIAYIRSNAAMLKLAPEIIQADAYQYLASFAGVPFDIVYADPPYALGEEQGFETVIRNLAERNVLKPGGLFIAETTFRIPAGDLPGWELCRDREYGKTRLLIWRRICENATGVV